jgi:LysR family transcriptional regulator (chromosome initiation inhibitor)
MHLDPAQLRALRAVVDEGTLEAAARALHVTPSAVSQRLKALETATGRVLLVRSKPARATASGEALVRLARQLDLLMADALDELGAEPPADRPDRPVTVALAVNADSLATWLLPALAPLAASCCFDLHVVDQDHTSALLRDGTVMAAVTSQAQAVPGCRVTRLGAMRYRPMASPAFAARWFPDGVTAAALARAPNVEFDRRDALQQRYLRRRTRAAVTPPVHHVPSSGDFLTAVRLGLGWGMLPDLHSAPDERAGAVVALDPRASLDVVLHWQQWRLRSVALDAVAAAVHDAARVHLRPSSPRARPQALADPS